MRLGSFGRRLRRRLLDCPRIGIAILRFTSRNCEESVRNQRSRQSAQQRGAQSAVRETNLEMQWRFVWQKPVPLRFDVSLHVPARQSRHAAGISRVVRSRWSYAMCLEPVMNFRAGSVASENRARRDGGRRLWWLQGRGRQRSMDRFAPQPGGLGPISPISLSLVASRHPIFTPQTNAVCGGPEVCVATRFSN